MTFIGELVNVNVAEHPFIGGIVVSVLMGIILTLPISSAALGIILNLSGLAAGAATVGCCANMVGFAVASYKDNKVNGLLAQGLGTSMLQIGNIVRRPRIWLAPTLTAAILGPVSTMVFKMTNSPVGAGMGTSGLVGPLATYATMNSSAGFDSILALKIFILHIVAPAAIALLIHIVMKKFGLVKDGYMKL
jgi:uncharacterized membrane protein